MAKIIAIINQKGGVGKTATACHLAYTFAEKNKRTLLVDIDPSANASVLFLKEDEPKLTSKDFLLSKETNVHCILPTYQGNKVLNNLSLIPSSIGLALTERELGSRSFRETLLSKKLRDPLILDRFDRILIDCPPTLSSLTINAMYAADFILVPVTYQKNALEGVADLFHVLDEIKEGHIYSIKILRNQFDARKKTVNQFIQDKLAYFEAQGLVLKTILRQDEAVNRATLENLTVFEHSPYTIAKTDFLNLTDELEEIFNG